MASIVPVMNVGDGRTDVRQAQAGDGAGCSGKCHDDAVATTYLKLSPTDGLCLLGTGTALARLRVTTATYTTYTTATTTTPSDDMIP